MKEKPQKRTRASALCVHDGKLLMVRLRDPVSQIARLFPPGGSLEMGETPEAGAERETLEETGYRVAVDPASRSTVDYPFQWAGQKVECRTHFFLARLASETPQAPQMDPIHEGVEWVALANVARELDFHPQLKAAITRLIQRGK